jgi:hypothetical protein
MGGAYNSNMHTKLWNVFHSLELLFTAQEIFVPKVGYLISQSTTEQVGLRRQLLS